MVKQCRQPLRQYYLQTPVGKLSLTTCLDGLHNVSYVDLDVELKNIDPQNEANLVKWIQNDGTNERNLYVKPDVHASTCFQWLVEYFNNTIKASERKLPKFCYMDQGDDKPDNDSFTIRVWKKLLEVPRGQTTTYSELAKNSGNAKASRAVGAAMRRNHCAILVPCHRVLPSRGIGNPPLKKQKIGEYANGRNKIKQWLIDFEAKS